MQEIDLIVKVRARDITPEKVVETLDRLINAGLEDAARTLESGEGDVLSAEVATKLHIACPAVAAPSATPDLSVPVAYWRSEVYVHEGGEPDANKTFSMEIEDLRETDGQVYIDAAPLSGHVDDLLSAVVEIDRLPGSKDDVQCLHLNFDADNLAVSIYKQGDRYILRPERGVTLRDTVLPNGEAGWILE